VGSWTGETPGGSCGRSTLFGLVMRDVESELHILAHHMSLLGIRIMLKRNEGPLLNFEHRETVQGTERRRRM
jgi:hypothetical protein